MSMNYLQKRPKFGVYRICRATPSALRELLGKRASAVYAHPALEKILPNAGE